MESNAFIIQLLEEKGGEIQGRVQLQKLVYFCKAMGVDVNANNKLYIYGPYSQQVANALQDCVADNILTESDGVIGKGVNYDIFLNDIVKSENKLSDISKKIVKDILGLCNQMTTKQLEITATTFFIDRQQKVLFGDDDKEAVIRKVSNAKGKRFNHNEIETSYQTVMEEFFPLEQKYAISG